MCPPCQAPSPSPGWGAGLWLRGRIRVGWQLFSVSHGCVGCVCVWNCRWGSGRQLAKLSLFCGFELSLHKGCGEPAGCGWCVYAVMSKANLASVKRGLSAAQQECPGMKSCAWSGGTHWPRGCGGHGRGCLGAWLRVASCRVRASGQSPPQSILSSAVALSSVLQMCGSVWPSGTRRWESSVGPRLRSCPGLSGCRRGGALCLVMHLPPRDSLSRSAWLERRLPTGRGRARACTGLHSLAHSLAAAMARTEAGVQRPKPLSPPLYL